MRSFLHILLAFFLLTCIRNGYAQTPLSSSVQDTLQRVEIIGANSLRQITLANGDVLQTLAGNARLRQGNTLLSGDSIVLNLETGVAEVFGNVHINDADTVNTYSQYLRYIGSERKAYLRNKVKLTDGRGVIETESLDYDLASGMATYNNGGRVVNGTTVLTSESAVYYSDTKDVYFKKNVHLTDPKYTITADSLLYNTAFKLAHFIAPTHIVSESGIINTRSGHYNLETGEAVFLDQSAFRDSTRSATGRSIALDENSGMVTIEGNGRMVDSANKVIVIGDQIFVDRKKNAFLATRKPVMVFYDDNDSTYLAADTLISGLRVHDTVMKYRPLILPGMETDSAQINEDSIRHFLGFHNVRIWNDSLQAVSDSLFFSTRDSVFRLLKNPVSWHGDTQISGDTMHMYTRNRSPHLLHVFNNAFVINNPEKSVFNQVSGRMLHGYISNTRLDSVRVRGNKAESIYYPQEEDGSYTGMNRSAGNDIHIYFVDKALNKVKFVKDVEGILYPLNQIPEGTNRLKDFNWQINRRPKHKLELFE